MSLLPSKGSLEKCPMLKNRGKVQVKSAGLVAPVCRPVSSDGNLVALFDMHVQTVNASECHDSLPRVFLST